MTGRRLDPSWFGVAASLCLIGYIVLEPIQLPAGLLIIATFGFGLIESWLRLRRRQEVR